MTRYYDDDDDDDEDHIDMRPVVRLGAWGICAVTALIVAVIAGRTEAGSERAGAALAALRAGPMELLTSRPSEAEAEARELAEAVRTLAADRDQLAARVAMLERSINDLTGSIARDKARGGSANPAARPDERSDNAQPGAFPPAAPLDSASTEEIRPPVEPQPGVGLPANVPLPRPGPLATIQSYVNSTALPPAASTSPLTTASTSPPAAATRLAEAPAGTDAIAANEAPKEIAIDIANATNVNSLRMKWSAISKAHPALLEGMRPLISVRDSARPGFTEFHLVAGPVVDAAAAARLCGVLAAARVPCRPAPFDGQRLDLR